MSNRAEIDLTQHPDLWVITPPRVHDDVSFDDEGEVNDAWDAYEHAVLDADEYDY